ncbi:exonuclease RecJ [Halococcus sp. PRR34]|uniref:exonuclease RecJ n=1 Tax=Halococcus sp. PRR34 TaxID=3020830 RepID=UPI0023630A3F|nr:exonuclease RecJ [Halococcus sp. PRR34]
MAVAGRSEDGSTADSAAAALREAGFVRFHVAPDGDALATAGLLARALAERDTPFQASVVRSGRPGTTDTAGTDDTTTVCIGGTEPADVTLDPPGSASEAAFEAARELGSDPDPILALAGAFTPPDAALEGSAAFEAARDHDLIEQRPGVAIPVTDLADGLAHTTLAHAGFSGDSDAVRETLDGRETADTDEERREVASIVALTAAGAEDATSRAAETVEHVLRPYTIAERSNDESATAPEFATVGGYADVLRACAHERPGTGLALAIGHDVRNAALSAWRAHAERAHAAVRTATTARHRNLVVARVDTDAPLATTARLFCDFRSPEPVVVAVGETEAAAAATDDRNLGTRMRQAAAAADGNGAGSERRGRATFTDDEAFVAAFREAMA